MFSSQMPFVCVVALAIVVSPALAQEGLVGEWHPQKGDLPAGCLVEFTKDGKLRINTVPEDRKNPSSTWSYRVEGKTLETVTKYGARELKDKLTIKSLADDELVIVDSRDHETTLRRGRSAARNEKSVRAANANGNYKFHVKNDSATQPGVWIIMDTNRERHQIKPGVTVIFQNANKLDNPTFRVYTVASSGDPGDLLFTDTFFANLNPFSWSRHLVWNGSKLTDKD